MWMNCEKDVKMKEVKQTQEQYEKGVKSGEQMHVYDTETREILTIRKDGYYPPEVLKKLVNVDHLIKKLG